MSAQIISSIKAAEMIKDESIVMVGGFLGTGSPDIILKQIKKNNTKNLTVIANDTSFPDKPLGELIVNKQISCLHVSHVGTNPETGKQMNSGQIKVNLIPQGTLAERIRCAGAGLGGVLTPTGVGTLVEQEKTVLTVENKKYLLELPLKADIAIIKAYKADEMGNLIYRNSARNFNPLMASAAQVVIAEVEQIVKTGEILPDEVITPAIFVDYLVLA